MSNVLENSTSAGPKWTLREDANSLRSRGASSGNHIVRLAQRRLQTSAYAELRDVKCSLQEGALVLDGRVSSYYMKQIAQTTLRDLVERLPHVERIDNRLQVSAN